MDREREHRTSMIEELKEFDREGFHPDWCIPPGHTLREWLDEERMTQVDMARQLGISTKHLNQILKGRVHYSAQVAVQLGRVTGVSPEFWYRLQANWIIGKATGKKEL